MFDPLQAIDTLNEHHVDYVIVGGWAATHHGATRTTQDLDICPELSGENLDRLAGALTALDAQLAIAPGQSIPVPLIDRRLLANMAIGNWDTAAGRVDILQHVPAEAGEIGYEQLRPQAVEVHDAGRTFLVGDLEQVTTSKRVANREKDREALPELDQLIAVRGPYEANNPDRDAATSGPASPPPSAAPARRTEPHRTYRPAPRPR